jgi:ABC-type amino acid transport substrate-binding protein
MNHSPTNAYTGFSSRGTFSHLVARGRGMGPLRLRAQKGYQRVFVGKRIRMAGNTNNHTNGQSSSSTGSELSRRGFLKLSGLTAFSVAGASFLTACGPAAQGTSSSSTGSSDSSSDSNAGSGVLGDGKTMRVGMEAAYAPYNWQASSESDTTIPIENVDGAYADGYDVQIAKKIAKALNMEPVAVKMSFTGLIDALNNGQIDIICAGMSKTAERAQSIDFSDPYLEDGVTIVVKKDSKYASATSLDDFSGASVLGQKDTLYDDVIDQIPSVNHLTPVSTVPNVVDHLENGTADAITFSSLSVSGLLKQYSDLVEVKLADGKGFKDATNPDNAGLAKGQDAVMEKVNAAIKAVSDDERKKIWTDCMDRQPE